jgi:hypothetical protein
VCDQITTYQKKIGFGHLICMLQFGTLPADLTRRSGVIPRLRGLGESARTATSGR